jgi:hypothetical protein
MIPSDWLPDLQGRKGTLRRRFTAHGKLQADHKIVSEADLQKETDVLIALDDTFFDVWVPRVVRYELQRRAQVEERSSSVARDRRPC